jgi:HlyD family secretion protein
MSPKWKRPFYTVLAAATMVAVALVLAPDPVAVEVSKITAGPVRVTVDEDGETRARDRFIVSAPIAGRVARIELREGDAIARDQVVAELWPLPLSAREREEQLARIAAAEAMRHEAGERLRHAQADHEQARRENLRMEKLVAGGLFRARTRSKPESRKRPALMNWKRLVSGFARRKRISMPRARRSSR